jgi:hypothetical protein
MLESDHVITETCSEHLLTGWVGRLDVGNLSTETCSDHLLTGLLRRPDHIQLTTQNETSIY